MIKMRLSSACAGFARPTWFENASAIETVMRREKELFANIDFYGGLLYAEQMGVPEQMLTAMICMNLCVGWMANIVEQRRGHNRLIHVCAAQS